VLERLRFAASPTGYRYACTPRHLDASLLTAGVFVRIGRDADVKGGHGQDLPPSAGRCLRASFLIQLDALQGTDNHHRAAVLELDRELAPPLLAAVHYQANILRPQLKVR